MLKRLFHRQVAGFEKMFRYDGTYLHEMIDASGAAAMKFNLFQLMAYHREDVPEDAWLAAKLAGALAEDCGPCTQLGIDMAVKAGTDPTRIVALLRGDEAAAGADAALGFRYGRAVATNSDDTLALVGAVRRRWGERGLVSLALAVAAVRVYPTLKRGLGHGQACQKLAAGGETIAIKQAA